MRFLLIIVLLLTGIFAWQAYAGRSLKGRPAPALKLSTLDGQTVDLAAQKGKVVVIDFWASWCPPCRLSLPHLQQLSSSEVLAGNGLVVWGVNAGEDAATVESFMTGNRYSFTVPMDVKEEAQRAYGVRGIPMTVIVGRDGKVVEVFNGYGEGLDGVIDNVIQKALQDKPK